jgi:hypothetical protein
MTPADFLVALTNYRGGRCFKCEGEITFATAYLSIHSIEFGEICAGPGRVVVASIPYCKTCEGVPDDRGCLHMPFAYIEPLVTEWLGELVRDVLLGEIK